MRMLAALAAALLLSGCWWVGPPFYAAQPDGSAPISAGRWMISGQDGKTEEHRLIRRSDGTFGAEDDEPDASRLMFHPLPLANRQLWIVQVGAVRDNEVAYGLAERRGDVVDLLTIMDCERNEALVRAAGGKVRVQESAENLAGHRPPRDSSGANPTCVFDNAAALERAMTAWVARNPRLEGAVQLHRVGD